MSIMNAFVIPIALLALLSAIDEDKSSQRYGISDGGASWTTMTSDPIPGIDAASVSEVTLYAGPPEGVSFVVWSDLPNSRSGNGGGGARDGAAYKGYHRAKDGRRIDIKAESRDGKTATISIDGVSYDLAKGGLLLVSTQQQPAIVKQVNLDLKTVPNGQEALSRFASTTVDIRTFFQDQRPPHQQDLD
ncbi:MAG: hypothetical protein KDA78_06180 [Planctomycetaceae bacterium]|nr:hypothetical protein [Planctomycetaceae bacterium]